MIKMQKMSQIWLNEIIPNWTEKRKDKKIREYFYMGLPDTVRGRVWMLCLGNRFSITKEYYEIQVKNSKEILEKYKINKKEEMNDKTNDNIINDENDLKIKILK